MKMFRSGVYLLALSCFRWSASTLAFQISKFSRSDSISTKSLEAAFVERRDFLQQAALIGSVVLTGPQHSFADDEGDLTSQLFNPDGSPKEGVETEAKFRTVDFTWDASDQLSVNVDGVNSGSTKQGSNTRLSYELPLKGGTGKEGGELYFDRSEGVNAKACDRIIVYQAPGTASIDRLQKASTIGVAKALDATGDLKRLEGADLIGGRTKTQDGIKYYEFDMAVAPKSCGDSKENLGLGFCPFDEIYLISSTVFDDRLYVFAVKSTKDEWKRANSDIRRVRSSFAVENV